MADSVAHQEYGKTRVEWLSNLNTEYAPPKAFRRTSIICTIGRPQPPAPRPRRVLTDALQAPRPTPPRRSTCSAPPA